MSSNQSSHAVRYAVCVEGLHKSFGDWPVLWDLDLRVNWGECVVIFGANGVGKTTLLRILSTQARPESGTATVAGYDLRRQAESVRRRVGGVGHQGFLYEDLTCQENLVFYGRLFGIDDVEQRVHAVIAQVGLGRRIGHKVKTLSHGLQKRLAIARAILHQPQVLLLDEPEVGLDQESLSMLGGLLSDWTQAGRTVIMTTHNIERGLAWADRMAVLDDGKIQFQEPAAFRDPGHLQRVLAGSPPPTPGPTGSETSG